MFRILLIACFFFLADSKCVRTNKNRIGHGEICANERRRPDVSGLSKELFAEHEGELRKNKDVKEENISFQIPSIFVQEPGKSKYRKRFLNRILQKYKRHHSSYRSSHECLSKSKILIV